MKREDREPEFSEQFVSEYEYAEVDERRKRRWSDEERQWRKERRRSKEGELAERSAPALARGFKL